MSKQSGPRLSVVTSCSGCEHERSESYRCQSDSGFDVYCDHPSGPNRRIGISWTTPMWCPLLGEARLKLATGILGQVCCKIDCGKLLNDPALPFCSEHMTDPELIKSWNEL